jgi:hypothetical protein
LHVLRQQVEIALCLSFYKMALSSLKHKCVNKGVIWTLIEPHLGNMMHVQYNINYIVKYLEFHGQRK